MLQLLLSTSILVVCATLAAIDQNWFAFMGWLAAFIWAGTYYISHRRFQ